MPSDRRDHPLVTTRSATALYVGAVLGPGVLILPGLAAEVAGPASVLAWAALLALSVPLAITFAVLGVRFPEAGGTAAYTRAAFGARAGEVTGWCFLTGVVIGAPAVALIGGFYVAELLHAGREAAVVAAAGMIAAVVAANAFGVRASARLQLGLAGVLAALLLVAVVSALPESRAENWTPFAPNGWSSVGEAASLLMLSFIGWEAVSHLAGELRDPAAPAPARDLRRARRGRRALPRPRDRDRRRARHRRAVGRPARRPDGRRARRDRAHGHRRPRGAADDGRHERLHGRRRPARRRAVAAGPSSRSRWPSSPRSRPSCWSRWRPACSASRA